jgi:hypothetical protein
VEDQEEEGEEARPLASLSIAMDCTENAPKAMKLRQRIPQLKRTESTKSLVVFISGCRV